MQCAGNPSGCHSQSQHYQSLPHTQNTARFLHFYCMLTVKETYEDALHSQQPSKQHSNLEDRRLVNAVYVGSSLGLCSQETEAAVWTPNHLVNDNKATMLSVSRSLSRPWWHVADAYGYECVLPALSVI